MSSSSAGEGNFNVRLAGAPDAASQEHDGPIAKELIILILK